MLREKRNIFDAITKDGKRVPFMPTAKSRWYSLNRRRNLYIVAGLAVFWMFSNPLGILYRNIKYSVMMGIERYKFRKILDEEDKEWEKSLEK